MSDKNPNPQGKGQISLLRDLESLNQKVSIRPKSLKEVSSELFTALFILHSDCNFSALPGKTYHLYRILGRYQLMLMGPDEWFSGPPGQYWATCHLKDDLTWSLELSEEAQNDEEFQQSVQTAQQKFQEDLEQAKTLKEALPFHIENMPYHQRVLAFALSKSLDASMQINGLSELSYKEASQQIENE